MKSSRARLRAVGLACITVSAAIASYEVYVMARAERDVGRVFADGDEAFVQTTLSEGQQAAFELCASSEGDAAEALATMPARVFFIGEDGRELAAERAFREVPEVQRQDRVVCAQVFYWERVLIPGTYAFGIERAPAGTEVRARILAWGSPTRLARGSVGVLFVGLLLFAFGLARDRERETRKRPLLRICAGVLALMLLMFGLSFLPANTFLAPDEGSGASLAALLRGLVIALGGVGFAIAFGDDLAFRWKGARIAALAVVLGVLTFFLGRWIAHLIPASSTAPIEAVLAAPSGSLALAIVGLVAPLAEELFFRGFVFGVAEHRWGTIRASLLSIVCFAIVHLPQQWGAWGAFASVSTAGLIFTAVRAKTGSSLGSGLAHLAHNGFITLLALL